MVPQGAATSLWAGVVANANELDGRLSQNCRITLESLMRRPVSIPKRFRPTRSIRSARRRSGRRARKWSASAFQPRRTCRSMSANAVRLQLHALAYNLANFFRTLVLPDEVEQWSLTTLRERVVKIGAKVIAHARSTVFQMAEVAVPRDLFRRMLALIDELRPRPVVRC